MTFIDSRTLPGDDVIDRDVCIIGAGPAGMAIAREFFGRTARVALIESGGIGIEDDVQGLSTGEQVGVPYPGLDKVRLRAFGGTTWHWGGHVKPLDTIDFERRAGIPDSGWPFGLETLQPYYARAERFFHLPDNAFERAVWQKRNGAPWTFRDDAMISQVFHTVGAAGRLSGLTWEAAFATARNVDVFLNVTVVAVQANDSVSQIREVTARTVDGRAVRFRARIFVLAAGGIENARFLLLASDQQKEGLGNEHGLVGRFFQEHLTNPDYGDLVPADPYASLRFYRGSEDDWGWAWGILRLPDKTLREAALPNIRFQLSTITNAFNEDMDRPGMQSLKAFGKEGLDVDGDLGLHVANVIGDIDYVASAFYYRLMHFPDYPLRRIEVVHIGEQLPNRESRVRLGRLTDRFGQRKAVLDWRLLEQDSDGVRRTSRHFTRSLGSSGLGRFISRLPGGVFEDTPPKPHFHHMGTTRMNADSKRGVVDADCRVHRLENFYVAGSSVFPTSGNVNPTLTIVALAMRLADHLKERLRA